VFSNALQYIFQKYTLYFFYFYHQYIKIIKKHHFDALLDKKKFEKQVKPKK